MFLVAFFLALRERSGRLPAARERSPCTLIPGTNKEFIEWWRYLCGRTLLVMYETTALDYYWNVDHEDIESMLHVVLYIAFYMSPWSHVQSVYRHRHDRVGLFSPKAQELYGCMLRLRSVLPRRGIWVVKCKISEIRVGGRYMSRSPRWRIRLSSSLVQVSFVSLNPPESILV